MKIYTRTGDSGSTGLFAGPRVSKDDARIEAYGTVDELNAVIGAVRSSDVGDPADQQLKQVQNELFSIGAELATPSPREHDLCVIGPKHIERIESWIDEYESELPPLKHFVLPGGTLSASLVHLARATCRRAERRVVTLAQSCSDLAPENQVSDSLAIYLNRLSDYFFVLSRGINQKAGADEVKWVRP